MAQTVVPRGEVPVHQSSRLASVGSIVQWVGFPLAGVVWMLTRHDRMWYLPDDLLFLGRAQTTPWWEGMFAGHAGHLVAVPFLVYRLQLDLVGIESDWLVFVVFCASLVAVQLSAAAVLRRLGAPTVVALAAATMVTYFGAGAQQFTSLNAFVGSLALAFCCLAAFVALTPKPGCSAAVSVSALLILSVETYSSLTIAGAVFVGTIVLLLWPWRMALVALALPVCLFVVWQVLDHSGSYELASWDRSVTFASTLILQAAGGLVGGGEVAGAIALGAASAVVSIAVSERILDRRVGACLAGSLLAVAVIVLALTRTRAYLTAPDMLTGHRYVQWVALLLLLGFAPALTAAIKAWGTPSMAPAAVATTVALIAVVFVLNLGTLWPVRFFNEAWDTNIKRALRGSVTVLDRGCADGQQPDPDGEPLAAEGQDEWGSMPVSLLQEMLDRGAVTADWGLAPGPATEDEICPPRG